MTDEILAARLITELIRRFGRYETLSDIQIAFHERHAHRMSLVSQAIDAALESPSQGTTR